MKFRLSRRGLVIKLQPDIHLSPEVLDRALAKGFDVLRQNVVDAYQAYLDRGGSPITDVMQTFALSVDGHYPPVSEALLIEDFVDAAKE